MVREAVADSEVTDGRHARRERGRAAVIDAVFELLQERRIPPPVDDVATRSGVSASTIFRYFDGLDDMQHQAFERFRERFRPMFDIAVDDDATPTERVAAFVDARITLYEQAGGIMLVGRLRALEHPPMAAAAAEQRALLAAQVGDHFAPVLDSVTPARRADLVALIDTVTAPEAWDTMRRAHGRTTRQVKRAWTLAIDDLIAATTTPTTTPTTTTPTTTKGMS